MLTPIRAALAVLALSILSACAPTPELAREQRVEATYRLLYNDLLVGHALFELAIDKGGHYRIEAFTTPAGEMSKIGNHEVLEASHGVIDADGIRPIRYDHSVREEERMALVNLTFDWEHHALQLADQENTHSVKLLPDTHDRLSYLLAASNLAAAERGTLKIRVASSDATEEGLLEITGPADIEVPQGSYRAIGVRRATPNKDERRELWFDTNVTPLPLLLIQHNGTTTVEMHLESMVSLGPNDLR